MIYIDPITTHFCFFCPRCIYPATPHVVWREAQGYDSVIRLHLKCSMMLGERLIGDAFEGNPDLNPEEYVSSRVLKRIQYAKEVAYERRNHYLIRKIRKYSALPW